MFARNVPVPRWNVDMEGTADCPGRQRISKDVESYGGSSDMLRYVHVFSFFHRT